MAKSPSIFLAMIVLPAPAPASLAAEPARPAIAVINNAALMPKIPAGLRRACRRTAWGFIWWNSLPPRSSPRKNEPRRWCRRTLPSMERAGDAAREIRRSRSNRSEPGRAHRSASHDERRYRPDVAATVRPGHAGSGIARCGWQTRSLPSQPRNPQFQFLNEHLYLYV